MNSFLFLCRRTERVPVDLDRLDLLADDLLVEIAAQDLDLR